MKLIRLFLLSCLFFTGATAFAATTPAPTTVTAPTQQSVMAATQAWANAINQRDAKAISALYNENAILFATFSNKLDTPREIHHYFVELTKKSNLKVEFLTQRISVFDGAMAVNSGKYVFSYTDTDGKTVMIPARYTFIYAATPTGWTIMDHHSSTLPSDSK